MKYMQSCSSVSAEVVSSFSAKQSSEHIAQSSEHEVANDDCNNIVHKHFLLHKRGTRAGWRGAMPYMGKDDS